MKIIKPYARILLPSEYGDVINPTIAWQRWGEELLKKVEWCARISHRSEEAVTNDSWKRIIKSVVLDHGDWSVVEHATVSVDMVVDRGITHEWVRHRLFGFTQESTRFVNYEKKMPPSFIYPDPAVACSECLCGSDVDYNDMSERFEHVVGPEHDLSVIPCSYDTEWMEAVRTAEGAYRNLLARKWAPQLARSVFPNALASRIITTGNLRNWRHVLMMRTTQEAHPQMKQVTIPLLKEFQEKIPLLFDDIVPNRKQSEAMKIAR